MQLWQKVITGGLFNVHHGTDNAEKNNKRQNRALYIIYETLFHLHWSQ